MGRASATQRRTDNNARASDIGISRLESVGGVRRIGDESSGEKLPGVE
jgi:hypothetical protein